MSNHARFSTWLRPCTRQGCWAVGLAAAFGVMVIIKFTVLMRLLEYDTWRHCLVPFYCPFAIVCGVSAGIVGLFAVIRKQERSWLVFLSILPSVFFLFLLLSEIMALV